MGLQSASAVANSAPVSQAAAATTAVIAASLGGPAVIAGVLIGIGIGLSPRNSASNEKTWQEWKKDLKKCHCDKHSDECCDDNQTVCEHVCDTKYAGDDYDNIMKYMRCEDCCRRRGNQCRDYKEEYPSAAWESCFTF